MIAAALAVLVEISWGLVVLAWLLWGGMALRRPLFSPPVLKAAGGAVWLAGILWLYNLTPAALAIAS